MTRLAKMCPRLSELQLSDMENLSKAGRLSIVSLFRLIIKSKPYITVLNMSSFSRDKDTDLDVNMGELVIEPLLSSNIDTITYLNFENNSSWFYTQVKGYSCHGENSLHLDRLNRLDPFDLFYCGL